MSTPASRGGFSQGEYRKVVSRSSWLIALFATFVEKEIFGCFVATLYDWWNYPLLWRRGRAVNTSHSVGLRAAREGAVVRALASHQCRPGSNIAIDVICGLSLMLVLSFVPRDFSLGTSVFPSLQNSTFPISRISPKKGRRRTTMWMCFL